MARVIMSRAATVAVIMIVVSVVVIATASTVMAVMAVRGVVVTVMTMVVLVIVATAAAVIVVACVTVIVIAGASVVIMTGMGAGALHRRGGNRRRRQLGHVEPERANFLGDILRRRFARGIAREQQCLGSEVDGYLGDSPQTAQGCLDLADAACAIHAVDTKAEPFTSARR